MSANISQIAIPSVKQYIEETGEDIADVLDIDLEYEPEVSSRSSTSKLQWLNEHHFFGVTAKSFRRQSCENRN